MASTSYVKLSACRAASLMAVPVPLAATRAGGIPHMLRIAVFQTIADKRECCRVAQGLSRCGITSLGKYKSPCVHMLGKGIHDLLNCFGIKRVGHAVVTRRSSRSEHLRLGKIQFFACGLFQPSPLPLSYPKPSAWGCVRPRDVTDAEHT